MIPLSVSEIVALDIFCDEDVQDGRGIGYSSSWIDCQIPWKIPYFQRILSFILFQDTFRNQKCLETENNH